MTFREAHKSFHATETAGFEVLDDIIITGTFVHTMMTAGATLSAKKIVTSDGSGNAIYASNATAAHAYKVIGMNDNSANSGESVRVITEGNVTNSTWTWTPGSALYLSTSGEITHTVPTTGFALKIGMAITATKIFIRIEAPVILA